MDAIFERIDNQLRRPIPTDLGRYLSQARGALAAKTYNLNSLSGLVYVLTRERARSYHWLQSSSADTKSLRDLIYDVIEALKQLDPAWAD